MTELEQIARSMCHLKTECETCEECGNKYEIEEGELCYFQHIAKEITTHDYRKASEVAREIFEDIEKLIIRRTIADVSLIDDRLITDIAELKKKYGGYYQ